MEVRIANSTSDIMEFFEALSQLRPHLKKDTFLDTINSLRNRYDFKLVYLREVKFNL
ncbi:hypothetical protein [Microbulbifer variabilis]|uniref:hypothetical protein n=1 Tax=Microbulbifer variabilis TaxID=266805 RepID=UPI001CFD9F35|nr:hypothetical protein [Microbulbifer variabilis]